MILKRIVTIEVDERIWKVIGNSNMLNLVKTAFAFNLEIALLVQ